MARRVSRVDLAWLALILAGLAAVYLPALGNAPVFDDDYLASGDLFSEYGSLFVFRQRPLSYGSFVWIHALFGDGWWKQRLANVLLHVATVLALWGFWREVMRSLTPSRAPGEAAMPAPYVDSPVLGLAIAFFALNPVAVYAVAYLIQRPIVMATLFVVVALWAFVRALRAGKPWLFALSAAAYVAAVASKEHAILAPLAAVPLYVVVARPPARRLAILAVAGVVLMALMGWALRARVGEILGTPIDEYSRVYLAQLGALDANAPKIAWPLSIVNQAWLFLQYGLRWMLPFAGWMSINLRPPFPLTLGTFPQVLGIAAYLGALLGGAWLVWRHRDWKALLGLALLLPALLFPTEFAIVWVQDSFVLYRSYIWAIGIPALVFCLLQGMSARVALAVGVVVGAVLAWQGFDRVLSLETPEQAWSDAIAKLPADPRSVGRWFPYLNRGAAYAERDELALALRDFQASEALGDLGMGALNAGAVLAARGKHAEALQAFDRAERQGYALYNLPFQRGLSLLALNRPAEAYAQFERARALDPPSPTRELMLLNLGRLGLQLGHAEQATKDLERLAALQPKSGEARYLLAMAYVAHGEPGRAKPLADALVAEGGGAPAYYARALAQYGLKRRDEALADIAEAMRRDPRNPMLREWDARIRALPAKP